jgi:hypothetical protein
MTIYLTFEALRSSLPINRMPTLYICFIILLNTAIIEDYKG